MIVKNIFSLTMCILLLFAAQSSLYASSNAKPKKEISKTTEQTKPVVLGPSYGTSEDQPFAPSYIAVKGGHKNITPDSWTDPEICAQCHPRQYDGWNGSMHSNSFKDPVFQALWAIGEKATNGKTFNHCASCHSPIGTATKSIKFNPDKGLHGEFTAPPIAAKGVSCDVCHTLSGTNFKKTAVLEHGNASFIMEPGNVKRATLKDAVSPFHETEYSEFHTTSEFCGNCHNIFHPDNHFPIERTYDEWKYSIYAQNGVQCMDCHMVPVETAIRVADELKRPKDLKNSMLGGFAAVGGPFREVVHDHAFVGGNAVITQIMGGATSNNYQEAVKRLQSVASLNMEIKQQKKQLHQLVIQVNNDRAGHNLPTSLTEVRQIWVEVLVLDERGKVLFRTGTLNKHNELPKGTEIFNAEAVDKDGNHTQFPWEITRFTRTNTIPPKGYKRVKYAFNIPKSSKSIKVVAKLNYRSFGQGLADLLLGKDAVQVPSINMVTLENVFPVTNGKVVATSPNTKHH